MYIVASYLKEFPQDSLDKPRERYVRYYDDLHRRYKTPLDRDTLSQGSRYKYHDLAYPLFDQLAQDEILKKIDTFVISHWAHEYDPDYATLGLHLAHQYHFSCAMFDVMDQGSLSALTALLLLKKLNTESSLCLALDQTTVPRSDSKSFLIPTKTTSVALHLSKNQLDRSAIKIMDVIVWSEDVLCDLKFNIIPALLNLMGKYQIDLRECVVSCKRNSILYRSMLVHQVQYQTFFENIKFNFLSVDLGCTEVYRYIHELILNRENSYRYHIYLEEDIESLTMAAVILEREG